MVAHFAARHQRSRRSVVFQRTEGGGASAASFSPPRDRAAKVKAPRISGLSNSGMSRKRTDTVRIQSCIPVEELAVPVLVEIFECWRFRSFEQHRAFTIVGGVSQAKIYHGSISSKL